MNTVKMLNEFITKEGDIKVFSLQLLNNELPYVIPDDANVRLVVANGESLLINKLINIVDKEQGIVEFDIENIGDGIFECEFILTARNIRTTFPEKDYQTIRIVPSLETKNQESITPTLYEILIERIDFVEQRLSNHTHEYEDIIGVPDFVTYSEMEENLRTKPSYDEACLKSDLENYVTNVVFTNELDKKSDKEHVHSYNDLTDKPTIPTKVSELTNDSNFQTEEEVNTKISNIDLSGKSDVGHIHSYNELTHKPNIPTKVSELNNDIKFQTESQVDTKIANIDLSGKSDVGHTHEISDVNGLTGALDGKANTTHTHEITDINGLETALNNKASSTHNHDDTYLKSADIEFSTLEEAITMWNNAKA